MVIYLPDIRPSDVAAFERLLTGFNYAPLRQGWPAQYPDDELRWVRVDPAGFELYCKRQSKAFDLGTLLDYAKSLAT